MFTVEQAGRQTGTVVMRLSTNFRCWRVPELQYGKFCLDTLNVELRETGFR